MPSGVKKVIQDGVFTPKGERGVFCLLKGEGEFACDGGGEACVDVFPIEGARTAVAGGPEAEGVGSPSNSKGSDFVVVDLETRVYSNVRPA